MITPEQLIRDLQRENERLQKELDEANEHIKDFEKLAIEWKKGHGELNLKHRVKMKELEQIISELEDEIEELKAEISLIRQKP